MAGGDLKSFILPESESKRIFEEEIIPEELRCCREPGTNIGKAGTPLAVFVVGQTGAGKTHTAPVIKEAIHARRGKPAHLIADTYKTYHPDYSRLSVEQPAMASSATGMDARRWLFMAVIYAIERRIDVLVESACRHPQDFADLAQACQNGGYRVEVAMMAVPAALSRLGILTRFYQRLPEAGSRNLPIRLTPKNVHDDSYCGILDAAKFVDDSLAVDQVVVLRRDNMVVYTNERINGVWKEPANAAVALLRERQRRLPTKERASAELHMEYLRKKEATTLLPELNEIQSSLDRLNNSGSMTSLTPLILPVVGGITNQGDGCV